MAGRAFRKAAQARAKADLVRSLEAIAAADASDDEGEEEVLPPTRPARNAFDLVRRKPQAAPLSVGPSLTPAPPVARLLPAAAGGRRRRRS